MFIQSVNIKSGSFYQIKNHNMVCHFCSWFRTSWCLAAVASNQLRQHLLRSWVREQKMETEASFRGFSAKLSAGSLAWVGFSQSNITAGKQTGAWGESVSFWLPSFWGLQSCGCFPPPQATASAGTQLSGFQELLSICPFRPAAGNCISLLLVQCASPINTLYSYPLKCYTSVSCQNPPTT